MRSEVGPAALAIIALAVVLAVANFGYGLVHETAHALAVKAQGGEVFGLYVNPLGLDAYMQHSPVAGTGFLVLELAGLCATTVVAMILAIAGKEAVPAFFALRTAIYALNYAPGTDIANVYNTLGSAALVISVVLVAINLFAFAFAIRQRAARLTGLFSSLSRGRLRHNSGE